MHVSDKLRRHIAQRGSEASLRDAALASGMISLGEDGLLKVKAGVTTPEELLRVVTEVREARSVCPECSAQRVARFRGVPVVRSPRRRRLPALPQAPSVGLEVLSRTAPRAPRPRAARANQKRLRPHREIAELPPASNVAEFKK